MAPIVIQAYEYGPPAGVTGAPGDNKTGCVESGCHSGTPNAGPGNVKILLPSGNTGTYTPGQSMQILVQITDASKAAYGFEMTARSGSGNTTQAGDFTTSTSNEQVICPDGSVKANGKTCPAAFPIEYIEHTSTPGNLAPLEGSGSLTYSFTWTAPATNVGNVTFYVAANAGPAGVPVQTPTNVYLSTQVLTPAASGPQISNVLDAASAKPNIVPGEWVAIYGSNFAPTGTFATWTITPPNLPTSVAGVSVNFGTLPASVYFVSPGQIDVQAPSGISGTVPVTVTSSGTVSASFNATVASNAPALFTYASGSNTFAAAQNASYVTIGDPAVTPGTVKALPGQPVVLYVNGLAPSPSGMLVSGVAYSGSVTVNIGSSSAAVAYAGLAAAGLYQVNITVPSGLTPGLYPVTVSTAGQTSPAGVMLPVGP